MKSKFTKVVCPRCRGKLSIETNTLECAYCQTSYPVRDGVPCFGPPDEFYETRYEPGSFNYLPNECYPWNRLLLYLVSMHYLWYVRRYLKPSGTVLDVACGGGTRYLTTKGSVVGLDVSFQSLKY